MAVTLQPAPTELVSPLCHPTTYHARSLHSLREARSIGLTPEHVAAEGGWAGSHDECKRVDVSAHSQEGEEAHATLPEHCFRLEGENRMTLCSTGI